MSDSKNFYLILNGLLNYLETCFLKKKNNSSDNSIKKIKKYRIGLDLLNKHVVIHNFYEHIKPHANEIYNKNEEYFLSTNILDFGATSDIVEDSLQIKELYITLENEDKDIIWESIQQLLDLSIKICK